MTCCLCLAECRGKQHWNQDFGYSICQDCAKKEKARLDPQEMTLVYGADGIHYFTKED